MAVTGGWVDPAREREANRMFILSAPTPAQKDEHASCGRNEIVYVGPGHVRLSSRLWDAMYAEFIRNGRKTLTAGKVRALRRQIMKARIRRELFDALRWVERRM
jgi:hypothetical protein